MKNYFKIRALLSKITKKEELTTKEMNFLKGITDFNAQYMMINKEPEILPYVLNDWSVNCGVENIEKLTKTAVRLKPELITKLGKGEIHADYDLVKTAMLSNPLVAFKFNKELAQMVDEELFYEAFAVNPTIIMADLPVLKQKVYFDFIKQVDDKKVEVHVSSVVRNECLKALRIAEGVSKYHKGYDDFAKNLAENILIKKKKATSAQTMEDMSNRIPTVVNAMIKKGNQKLRACPVETWRLNNNKTLYAAVRESTKENSNLKDLLGDIPTMLLPEKVVKKAIATAIKQDPTVFAKLDDYCLESYRDDAYIQYVTYKSCIKHRNKEIINKYFDEKAQAKAKSKVKAAETRAAKKAEAQEMEDKKLEAELENQI